MTESPGNESAADGPGRSGPGGVARAAGDMAPVPEDPAAIPGDGSGTADDVAGPADDVTRAAGDGTGEADLVVAFVPGVMPGKWFFRWRDRHPGRVLAERPLETDAWQDELTAGRAHACFARLPAHPRVGVDDLAALRDRFRAVELYAEQQVVVLPRDHELTLLDEVPVAELVDEVLLQQPSTLPERERLRPPGAAGGDAPLPPIRHARDAIELVAAGLGLVVVPMSVARLNHRKDLVHRVVPDAATAPVVLVWPQDLPDEREDLVQGFVGVVRGRSPHSSRGSAGTTPPEGGTGSGPKAARAAPPRRGAQPPGARRGSGSRGGRAAPRSGHRSGGRGRR